MTQSRLDQTVARLTNEGVDFVWALGFSEVWTPSKRPPARKAMRLSAAPWRLYRQLMQQPQQPRRWIKAQREFSLR